MPALVVIAVVAFRRWRKKNAAQSPDLEGNNVEKQVQQEAPSGFKRLLARLGWGTKDDPSTANADIQGLLAPSPAPPTHSELPEIPVEQHPGVS